MSTDQLLDSIVKKTGCIPPAFSRWVKSSDRFRDFAGTYEPTISKKFADAMKAKRDQKLEICQDTLFELEIAYLVLTASEFSVRYQLHNGGPDLTFADNNGVVFNVEVKHIRKTCEEKRLERWRAEVAQEVREVPSVLAVAIDIGLYIDELNALVNLLHRLEVGRSAVVEYIVNTIRQEEKNVPIDGVARYSIPGLEGQVELELRKPSGKPSSEHTDFYGGVFPLFLTKQESGKFMALIFPTKNQRIPCEINILAINTRSATHDSDAFIEELEADFKKRVALGNVTKQMKQLSGILFRGAWGDYLWRNEIACCPIPETIAEVLRRLPCD